LNLALSKGFPLSIRDGLMLWEYLFTSKSVANGDVDKDFIENGSVVQGHGKAVADRSFGGVVVVQGNLRVFDTIHFVAEGIDSRIRSDTVLIVLGGQSSVDQRNSDLRLERK
jgi:hypothetical protein